MNERIQELAFAATEGSNWKPGLGNPQVQEYMEKFAELVAQECINAVREEWYRANDREPDDRDPRSVGIHVGTKSGLNMAMNAIRAHFRAQE